MRTAVTNQEIHARMKEMDYPRALVLDCQHALNANLVGLFAGRLLIVDNRGPVQIAGTCNVDINSLKPL